MKELYKKFNIKPVYLYDIEDKDGNKEYGWDRDSVVECCSVLTTLKVIKVRLKPLTSDQIVRLGEFLSGESKGDRLKAMITFLLKQKVSESGFNTIRGILNG